MEDTNPKVWKEFSRATGSTELVDWAEQLGFNPEV